MISLSILTGAASLFGAKKAPMVTNVEPPYWWTDMQEPSLQVMVTGPGIADARVSVAPYPGVELTDTVSLDSPNYKFLYFNISPEAAPGKLDITFNLKGRKYTLPYELRQRDRKGEDYAGFDASDVLYLLMPDRFAQGDFDAAKALEGMQYPIGADREDPNGRHGGNIRGIIDRLDYIDSLGVTAIWSCPVLENDMPGGSYHGYATTDYYRIDPRFGTNEDWQQLVTEANKKGIKVVMDMIFNHSGISHPWVKDMPSKDWLNHPEGDETTNFRLSTLHDPYVSDYDLDHTVNGWFVTAMPDLNQRNPHLMKYLIQNSIWWIESSKISDIRMDTYPYAYKQPMARWMKRLNDEYPNFNVVGETWVTEPAYTAAWQKDSPLSNDNSYLPTVMDFSFYEKLDSAKNEETDGWWKGYNRIYNSFVYDYLYKDPSHVMAFIENHDTDRFLADGKDVNALKQALALLLTVKRIPQLYYGTEVLMNGTKQVTDGNVRKDFMGGFPGDKRNCFTREGRTAQENDMFDWLSAVLHWRQHNDVIAKGTMTQFCPYGGVYVVARRYQGKKVMTVLNGTSKAATLSVNRYAEVIEGATTARDVPTGKIVDLTRDYNLAPREALILEF